MSLSLGLMGNTYGIYCGGPKELLTMKVSTGETIYPGQPVTIGAAFGEIAAADADDDVILGIALDNTLDGVEDPRAAYTAGQFASVGIAPGMRYMARSVADAAIAAGVILKADATGDHVAADPTADEYDEVVARLLIAKPATVSATSYNLARFGGVA